MDVDDQPQQNEHEGDVVEEAVQPPKAKRPRLGRNAVEVLTAIEKDSEGATGWARYLRAALLHAGESRRPEEDVAFVFRRQGEDLLNAVRSHGDAAIDIIFEAVLNLPQSIPLIAFVVSIAARVEHISSAPGADGSPPPPPFLVPILLQLSRRLSHALSTGHPLHCRALLRFLASLSSQGTMAASTVLEQLSILVEAAAAASQDDTEGQKKAVFLVHSVLSALPWWANSTLAGTIAAASAASAASDTSGAAASGEAGTSSSSPSASSPSSSSSATAASAAAASHHLLGLGANDPSVTQGAAKLLRRCEELLSLAEGDGGESRKRRENEDDDSRRGGSGRGSRRRSYHPSLLEPSADALSATRQQQLSHWIDQQALQQAASSSSSGGGGSESSAVSATEAAMRATLLAASQPDTVKLCKAVRSAMMTMNATAKGADDDRDDEQREEDEDEWRPQLLAVPTIARPQDDPALARMLLERPRKLHKRQQQQQQPKGSRMEEGEGEDSSAEANDAADAGVTTAAPFSPLGSDAFLLVSRQTKKEEEGDDNDDTSSAAFAFAASAPPAPAAASEEGSAAASSSSFSSPQQQQLVILTSTGPASFAPLAPPPSSFSSVPEGAAFHVKSGMQLFGPGGGLSSTPAVMGALQLSSLNALALWCLRDVCSDVLVTYHPFQQETAQALLNLPFGPAVAVAGASRRLHPYQREHQPALFGLVVVALEAILAQMLEPAASSSSCFPQPYYSLVIINILAQEANPPPDSGRAPSDLGTRALGMAARVLWKFLFALDDSILPKFAAWLAHHVSCTRWEWIWDEWASSLTADDEDGGAAVSGSSSGSSSSSSSSSFTSFSKEAQKRLMSSLLQRTFALVGPWHYSKIVHEKFPASLLQGGFIPPVQGEAASSVFFPEITIADANASKSLSASGAEGGGSSSSVMDDAAAAIAAAAASSSSSSSSSSNDTSAADAAAIESFVRKVSKESPGLYGHYLIDRSSIVDGCRGYAAAVINKMRARLDANQMGAWLASEEQDGGIEAAKAAGLWPSSPSSSSSAAEATRFLLFCHSLLMYSKANMRNTRIILERYRPLLLTGASTTDDSNEKGSGSASWRAEVLLDAVSQVWAKHKYLGTSTITDLLELELVTVGQVARHALKLSAFDLVKAGVAPASYPSAFSSAGGGVAVSASAALSLFTDRCLSLDAWELLERLLQHARDNAHRGRTELSLFLGARPYDLKEEELDEDVAAAKEAGLRDTARRLYYRAYLQDGLKATLEACADLCRILQKHLEVSSAAAAAAASSSSAAGASVGAALGPQQTKTVREALRVALAHFRGIVRGHLAGAMSEVRRAPVPMMTEGEDGALYFDKDAFLSSLEALAKEGFERMDLDPDLAGTVLETALGSPSLSTHLAVPEALLRDADVPQPSAAL